MNTELNVNDLKIGDVVRIKHNRKGIFTIKVTSNNSDSEWLGAEVYSDKPVYGTVNTWVNGERIPCRKSFITILEKLQV